MKVTGIETAVLHVPCPRPCTGTPMPRSIGDGSGRCPARAARCGRTLSRAPCQSGSRARHTARTSRRARDRQRTVRLLRQSGRLGLLRASCGCSPGKGATLLHTLAALTQSIETSPDAPHRFRRRGKAASHAAVVGGLDTADESAPRLRTPGITTRPVHCLARIIRPRGRHGG